MDQQLRMGRIVLEDAQASQQQVIVDLVFIGDNPKRGMEYYGVWKDYDQGAICPFVLNEKGEADFGTSYSGDDRIYQFDILTTPLAIGQPIGWRSDQYETQMKVVSVTQLV